MPPTAVSPVGGRRSLTVAAGPLSGPSCPCLTATLVRSRSRPAGPGHARGAVRRLAKKVVALGTPSGPAAWSARWP